MAEDNKKETIMMEISSEQLEGTLKDIKDKNREKLQNIKEKIQNLRKENEKLSEHQRNLKFQIQEEMKNEEFMKFALYKAHERAPVFFELTNKEVKELISIGERTEEIYNNKIGEYSKLIKETQHTLEGLLKNVLHENENLAEKLRSFMDQHSSLKFLPIKEDDNIKEVKNSKMNPHKTKKSNSLNVVEHKKAESNQERPYEEIDQVFIKALTSKSNIVKADSCNKEEKLQKNTGSNFWDSELFNEINNEEICEDTNFISSEAESHTYKIDLNGNKNKPKNTYEENKLQEKVKKEHTQEKNKLSKKEDTPNESKALASDINNIRSKYLIGKVTGEDLLDNEGKIIVPKDSLITNDIIKFAEEEGKLAELIVNMTIPEISE